MRYLPRMCLTTLLVVERMKENYGQVFPLHYVRSAGPLAYIDSDLNKGDLDYDWRTKIKEDYGQW